MSDTLRQGDLDPEGYLVGPRNSRIGICDDCGSEALTNSGCCSGSISPVV